MTAMTMRSILLLLFAFWTTLSYAADPEEIASAGIDGHAKATYFVEGGYVFALNVVENGDVYYHMNADASHSWFGIGFGSSMTNTRMLISYLSANGANVTNTCRMSYGHSEPEHDPDCKIENIASDHYAPYENTISPSGVLIAHAVCRNCSSWLGGALDIHNEEQPFIYALGPNETLHSDDLNAPLRLHSFYGTFTMNMTQATNYTGDYGRVPAPQDPGLQVGYAFWAFANYYSSTPYNTGTLADWSPVAHAVFMCLAFILIFPLGIVSLRLLRRAMFHAAAQMVGLAFVLIGFGFGIYAAKLYNKVSAMKIPIRTVTNNCAVETFQLHASNTRPSGIRGSLPPSWPRTEPPPTFHAIRSTDNPGKDPPLPRDVHNGPSNRQRRLGFQFRRYLRHTLRYRGRHNGSHHRSSFNLHLPP